MSEEIYDKDGVKASLEIEDRLSKKDPGSDEALREVARRMGATNHQHMGSAAFHVFADTLKGQLFIVAQTPLDDVNELVGNMAIKELAKKCMNYYGRKAPGLRDETPWEEQEND